MGKFSFDEEDERQEPTFSLADFKKWLNKQGKGEPDLKIEDAEPKTEQEVPRDPAQEKEQFKENLRKKRRSKKKED